jgi:DNA-binding response OmpR family regulator
MPTILIIEDEEALLEGLSDNLIAEGYRVLKADCGKTGVTLATRQRPDLIILDVMLPDISGLVVCRELRAKALATPIIMLTAKSQELDRVLGLEIGADDYVTKPFSLRELIARIHARLRRPPTPAAPSVTHCRFGPVAIDFKKYEARKNGRPVELTALEFKLLRFLVEHSGEVLERDAILDAVWGKEVYVQPRTVDLHMAHLRKKLEADPANPQHLLGVRGVGYKFVM